MVNMDFNFGGVEGKTGGNFEPFQGTVRAVIEAFEIKDTKPKEGVEQKASDGTPARYVNTTYKVLEGEEALDSQNETIDVSNRKVWGITSIRFPEDPLDDSKDERTTRELFLGWLNTISGADFDDHEGGVDFNAFVGNEVTLVCTIGSYNGKPNQNVKRVMIEDPNSDLDSMRSGL